MEKFGDPADVLQSIIKYNHATGRLIIQVTEIDHEVGVELRFCKHCRTYKLCPGASMELRIHGCTHTVAREYGIYSMQTHTN